MSEKIEEKRQRLFALEETFPDADEVFTSSFKKLTDICGSALIVLDTNVLLVPYSIGNNSLEKLKDLYKKLIGEERLFVPKRVAREFASNRNNKLGQLYEQIFKGKSVNIPDKLGHPILDNLSEKKNLDSALVDLKTAYLKYSKSIDDLAKIVKDWGWDDPVSLMYSELFNKEILIEHGMAHEELSRELARRVEHKIPPGYKDANKSDGGIGDLAIWLSLLCLGKNKMKDAIFVTEDQKSDWWNRSNGTEFLPRYELIDEYRRKTGGCTLHIVRLSKLLEIFEMAEELIKETHKAEREAQMQKMRLASMQDIRRMVQRVATLPRALQVVAVKDWFLSEYSDPAESCPYESREGGYLYIWGGPYNARDKIESVFGGMVSQGVIDEAVDVLEECAQEWSARPKDF